IEIRMTNGDFEFLIYKDSYSDDLMLQDEYVVKYVLDNLPVGMDLIWKEYFSTCLTDAGFNSFYHHYKLLDGFDSVTWITRHCDEILILEIWDIKDWFEKDTGTYNEKYSFQLPANDFIGWWNGLMEECKEIFS
ncbi:MAG: hypothetical protein IJX27_04045, partial [Clostridia bacterium]|nr:hypothetical protein [Clostridia bacterium]